jgi:hypothetical protein
MANTKKPEIIQVTLSCSAVIKNPIEGENNISLAASITLSLGDEHEADRQLKERPEMAELLPKAINALLAGYDPDKSALSKLKESAGIK